MATTASTARITAGQLDQRITLQQRSAGADVLGQPSGAWADVASVWAKARPLRSREVSASVGSFIIAYQYAAGYTRAAAAASGATVAVSSSRSPRCWTASALSNCT